MLRIRTYGGLMQMGTTGSLSECSCIAAAVDVSTVYSNTLTLLNTDLLLWSGVVSIAAVHSMTMKSMIQTMGLLLVVVMLGTTFLLVQCCEYLHLY